jgi:hypothetical protein
MTLFNNAANYSGKRSSKSHLFTFFEKDDSSMLLDFNLSGTFSTKSHTYSTNTIRPFIAITFLLRLQT